MLYIPANRREWVVEAPETYDADGFIFDLEDAVPVDEKAAARTTLVEAFESFDDPDQTIAVRLNPPDTGYFEADLDAIVSTAVDAVVLPKLREAEDVERVAHLLSFLERRRDVADPIEIVALPETAAGFRNAYDLCAASDRVAAIVGATSKGADVERALGFEWTRAGEEKRYMLSKLAMDGRAAGISQVIGGPWLDVDDVEGLRAEARLCRQLGCTGYQVIHPSHVEPVNEVFSPDAETVERCRDILEAVDVAETDGHGAVRYDGEMIDLAHVRYARDVIDRADAIED